MSCEKGFPTCCVLQRGHSNKQITVNFSFVMVLSNVVIALICWHDRHRDVLHGMHSPLVTFSLTFRSVWLCLIVFVPMIFLNDVFLRKAMIGIALNLFPNVLLKFNVCQCLLIISLIFGKVGLHVIEN